MAEDFILSQGARPAFKGYMGFPATLCVSIEDAVVHGIPGKEILTDGQIVGIDCGAELDGYYGDHAKSFAVGSINPDKQKLLTVTRESLMKGIEQAKPGNYVGDIGSAVQVHAERHGFSVVRELVGHGIGTELHEEPQIPNYGRAKQGYKLRAGMCIAIEPMINAGVKEVYTAQDGWTILTKDGKVSAHFEHTIAITENGPKILSVGTHG
jgi:methionyl aminopeptidase